VEDLDEALEQLRGLERAPALEKRGDAKRMRGDFQVQCAIFLSGRVTKGRFLTTH